MLSILLLFACLLAVVISGVQHGRKATLARHEDNRRKLMDALTVHGCITALTVLYGIFASAGTLWIVVMLLGSLAGLGVGYWAIRQVTPEDLKDELLSTDAILEK